MQHTATQVRQERQETWTDCVSGVWTHKPPLWVAQPLFDHMNPLSEYTSPSLIIWAQSLNTRALLWSPLLLLQHTATAVLCCSCPVWFLWGKTGVKIRWVIPICAGDELIEGGSVQLVSEESVVLLALGGRGRAGVDAVVMECLGVSAHRDSLLGFWECWCCFCRGRACLYWNGWGVNNQVLLPSASNLQTPLLQRQHVSENTKRGSCLHSSSMVIGDTAASLASCSRQMAGLTLQEDV